MQKNLSLLVISLLLITSLLIGPLACSSQRANSPLILLSDFGAGDYRVSQLKGFILSQNLEANLIDASHSVPSFDVPTGAFLLYMAAKESPAGIVFVGVVNTYTASRYLVLTTQKDQIFVVPDNGLLTYVVLEMGVKSLYQVDNQSLFKDPISDLSAENLQGTIAGKLSSGFSVKEVGSSVSDQKMLDIQESTVVDNTLLGTVINIDSFGNCITNISESAASQFGLVPEKAIQIKDNSGLVDTVYGKIYSDVPQGEEIVFVNTNLGLLQLSINLGNYSTTHQVKAGDKISIQKATD